MKIYKILTLKEISEELNGKTLASTESHNRDELMSLIDELTDNIENERLEFKRVLYKNYFKKILMTPTNRNLSFGKIFVNN